VCVLDFTLRCPARHHGRLTTALGSGRSPHGKCSSAAPCWWPVHRDGRSALSLRLMRDPGPAAVFFQDRPSDIRPIGDLVIGWSSVACGAAPRSSTDQEAPQRALLELTARCSLTLLSKVWLRQRRYSSKSESPSMTPPGA
jgi:hypothetical protein